MIPRVKFEINLEKETDFPQGRFSIAGKVIPSEAGEVNLPR